MHLASHDALTGLPNRMRFAQKLETAIHEAAASGEGLAVLFVDLDGFKQINDQFGHAVGDRVLATVARRLQAVLPEREMVARLGGDEFIVLIRGAASTDAAPGIAAGIIDSLNEVLLIDGQPMVVGASIGISQYPADGASAEMLLLNADAAMYAAKSGSTLRGCATRICSKRAGARGPARPRTSRTTPGLHRDRITSTPCCEAGRAGFGLTHEML